MRDKNYFLDNLDKSLKIEVRIKNCADVSEIVSFLQANEIKYGYLDSELSDCGLLYLRTTAKDQRRAFIEDVFSKNAPQVFKKIIEMDYVETTCHIPEELCSNKHQPCYQ